MTTAAARRSLVLSVVLLALALAGAGRAAADSYSANVLADQPAGYWRLGELGGPTSFDSGPFHYDAQNLGAVAAPGALFSDPDGGASFAVDSKVVSAQDWSWLGGAPIGGQPNRAFSLEFWIKPTVIDDRYLWVISEEDKLPVRRGWGVMLTQQPGQPATISYERWSNNAYVGGVFYRNDNAKLPNALGVGKWTYVVVTYDGAPVYGGTNTLHLWINGVRLQSTTAQPADMPTITQRFRIGQGDDVGSQPGFIGSVDEVAIYGHAIWSVPDHYRSAFVAPQNTAPPSLSGTAARGQTLTTSTGTWTGGPAPAVTVQWQRCDGAGAACAAIAGATATTYTVADADAGSTLRAQVTGTNGGGAVTVSTSVTALVRGVAPASTAAPAISGTGNVGDALTASSGSWSGVPAPTFAYQWQRCNGAGALCSDLPGATASTYAPTVTDAGAKLVVRVVATNFEGSATAVSPAFAVSSGAGSTLGAPVSTALPTISGNPLEGATLTAAPGSWSNAPTGFAYQWERCATTCAEIAGATGATYLVTSADVGSGLAVVVTATNASGSASATSATTAPVGSAVQAPAPPVATTPPSISGQPVEGAAATASPGAWSGSPTSFAYHWQRCGATCVDVPGATAQSYSLSSADVGSTLIVTVTATGPGGSASASSSAFGPVVATAPASTVAPTISGTPVDGATLTASTGTWSGTAPIATTFQWQRCDVTCAPIAGATGATYTAGAADVGSALVVVVTATNAAGTATATSTRTARVAAAAPVSTAAPAISGAALAGATLTATPGTWSGTVPIAYAYQWQRCANGACADVAGATGSTYALGAADVGSSLDVVVTATNAGGSVTAASAQTDAVKAAAPVSKTAPAVTGTAADGQTLTATTGTWDGTGPLAQAYAWQRCDASGASCAAIPGADAATYAIVPTDVGSTLRVVVTATNAAGSASAPSVVVGPVVGIAPASTAAPIVTGAAAIGSTLTASAGAWNGTAPLTYAYQWQRCAAACAPIAGATTQSYVVQAADYGAGLRVDVTAKNGAGTTTASSTQTAVVPDTIVPTLAISSVATGGIAIAGWNATLLLTVTVTASDAESGLAAAPTCTVDGRAATLQDAGDDGWTLSVAGLGSHAVGCSVADNAGNQATVSATVTSGGARELEQSLLTQVNKVLATATPRDAARLTRVAAALGDALTPANWVDANHLVASRGRHVFDANQEAAGVLVDVLKDRQSQVPDATTISMLLTIAQVDRVLAATAVADAASTKTGKAKANDAKDELDKSDTAAVRGDTMSALAHFESAWRKAQK